MSSEKTCAIFGAGVSGNAVGKWLTEAKKAFVVYDKSGIGGARTDFTREYAREHGCVVYSPGFPPEHPWLKTAREENLPCIIEPDYAAKYWHAGHCFGAKNLTAVTGTNGKTTLTEFLAFAHREAGRTSVAVGNNGIPFTTLLFDDAPKVDFPICEISSFQAECMNSLCPKHLLWTNFDEDHLDRHGTEERYFRAKLRLAELQMRGNAPGACIVGESVASAARRFGIALPAFTQVATREEVRGKIPENCIFNTFPQAENYAIARRYWLANGYPLEELDAAARRFTPKAHRLACCASTEFAGTQIEFWNDSKGTNFHAVYAALETFPQVPVFWIGGGLGKGGDLAAFCRRLAPKISGAYLIGETAPELLRHFDGTGTPATRSESLDAAVCAAFSAACRSNTPRAIVLFSPGFASFDMFKSYADRGKCFESVAHREVQKNNFSKKVSTNAKTRTEFLPK